MKKTLLLIACFGLSSFALADDALVATPGNLIKVDSVHSTVKTEAGMKTTMHVEALATFPNSCMAPTSGKELVTTTQIHKDGITYDVSLLRLLDGRICTTDYKPVQKTIVITDLLIADGQPSPLILPVFTVNGVKATSTH